jgi:prevent-host-death family protein
MADYPTVTKRELNQQTAKVLDRVREGGAIVITEHGVPRWRIEAVEDITDPVERLRAQGKLIPASDNPPPWPDFDALPRYTPEEVDALYRWVRGDH